MRGLSGKRLAWGILGIAVLVASAVGLTLAATAGPAPAASSPASATSSHTGRGGAVSRGGASTAAPSPVWCCTAGSPLGLTATGQAAVSGASATARASAITKATADAVSQATAAAKGAGISLGRIINIDVSGPSYSYPLPPGAAGRAGTGGSSTAEPGGNGTESSGRPIQACPSAGPCPYPVASGYVTVTITWAIG